MIKKQKRIFLLLSVIIIVSVGLSVVAYLLIDQRRTKFVRYAGFGIDMPVNYQIHGIDISHHQGVVNWPMVKAMQIKDIKIGFAFIKATEGLDKVDAEFRYNWANAKKAGIPRGAYHYFIASKSGKAQAEHFIEMVKLEKGDLPPVLDVEETFGTDLTDLQQRIQDWSNMVESHYKVKPIIYTAVNFYENFLAGRSGDHPLWVAHYLAKEKPRIKREWLFWQHNEKGHVNGIDAFVDLNVFQGDSTDLKDILLK